MMKKLLPGLLFLLLSFSASAQRSYQVQGARTGFCGRAACRVYYQPENGKR